MNGEASIHIGPPYCILKWYLSEDKKVTNASLPSFVQKQGQIVAINVQCPVIQSRPIAKML